MMYPIQHSVSAFVISSAYRGSALYLRAAARFSKYGLEVITGNPPMSEKPAPVVDEESREYWAAGQLGRLLLKLCRDCQRHHFFPRVICPHCHSLHVEWTDARGTGTIYSFTVARRPAGPAFKEDVPYAVALVELDEGPRMMTRILGDADAVRINMAVEVDFATLADTFALPFFKARQDAC